MFGLLPGLRAAAAPLNRKSFFSKTSSVEEVESIVDLQPPTAKELAPDLRNAIARR